MTHLWVRAEQRPNEERVGLTPEGAAALIARRASGSASRRARCARSRSTATAAAGCEIVAGPFLARRPARRDHLRPQGTARRRHAARPRHIMFGHAFKGQHAGRRLLARFKAGGGTLYDLEYLVDETGRRVAAFGYWAGFAGAAVSLMTWVAQRRVAFCGPVGDLPEQPRCWMIARRARRRARRRPAPRPRHRRARPGRHRGGRSL